MFFILQKQEDRDLDIDILTLKQELNRTKYINQYTYMNVDELSNYKGTEKIDIKEVVPVGSIEFVQTYLSTFHNINHMSPIEVPEVLRQNKYLLRDYSIITKDELLKKEGYAFVKYASQLKVFSHTGLVEQLFYEEEDKEPFLKDGLYVFSEVKNILSEYRVFVSNDTIYGIQFYDGNPLVMPTPDEIKKIQEMVVRYMLDSTRPRAYSLDVAIIEDDSKRDLMLIECHTFASLGLYGVNGSFLPFAYRNGLDWYIKENTPIKAFSNIK